MRHEFLDEGTQKAKKFAQPFLDEQSILVAIQYIFFASHEEVVSAFTKHFNDQMSLPHKIKKVIENSMCGQSNNMFNSQKQVKNIHSFSGHIIAVGNKVSTLRPGDAVACIGISNCVNKNLACIPSCDAVRLSDIGHLKETSVAGFALRALHVILRANLQVGHVVCVIGFDALGYLIMQLAKLGGATVIVVDDSPSGLQIAKLMGAHHCYNSTETGWQEEISYITQHYGVDITLVVKTLITGIAPETPITLTRRHGRIVLVGNDDIHIDHAIIGKKDIDFAVVALNEICHYDEFYIQNNTITPFLKSQKRTTLQRVLRLIEHKELNIEHLIKDHIESNNLNSSQASTTEFSMGIILSFPPVDQMYTPPSESEPLQKKVCTSPSRTTQFVPAKQDRICVWLIGTDNFIKNTLIPALSHINNITIRTITDIEQVNTEQISHSQDITKMCIIDSELLQNGMDVIIIASNDIFHTDRVIHALEHYRAIFVKEPLASTFEQLSHLTTILGKYNNVPVCLNYYRSYAPFMRKIKHAIQKKSTPLMIRYRINTNTPLRCTDQDTMVGSIVSNACHFLDVFYYLTDANPVAISVEAIHTTRDDIFPTDNFAAQISFSDGSVCSLVYTSLGHEHFIGEHLEIFFDAKAIVMQNFLTLRGYGLPSWFDEVVPVADNGRTHIIHDFFSGLRETPIRVSMTHERIITISKLALIIDKLACMGGGSKNMNEE